MATPARRRSGARRAPRHFAAAGPAGAGLPAPARVPARRRPRSRDAAVVGRRSARLCRARLRAARPAQRLSDRVLCTLIGVCLVLPALGEALRPALFPAATTTVARSSTSNSKRRTTSLTAGVVARRDARNGARLQLGLALAHSVSSSMRRSSSRWRPASWSASSSAGAAGRSMRSQARRPSGARRGRRFRRDRLRRRRDIASLALARRRRASSSRCSRARSAARRSRRATRCRRAHRPRPPELPGWLRPLRDAGRMPLSNYLLQTAARDLRLLRLGPRPLEYGRAGRGDRARDRSSSSRSSCRSARSGCGAFAPGRSKHLWRRFTYGSAPRERERLGEQRVRRAPHRRIVRPGVDHELVELERIGEAQDPLAHRRAEPTKLRARIGARLCSSPASKPRAAISVRRLQAARARRARDRCASDRARARGTPLPRRSPRRAPRCTASPAARDGARSAGRGGDRARSPARRRLAVGEEIGERVRQAEMRGELRAVVGAAEDPDLGRMRPDRMRGDAGMTADARPRLQVAHLDREFLGGACAAFGLSARAVRMSPPGARPTPRSIRPGASASRTRNCSATLSAL